MEMELQYRTEGETAILVRCRGVDPAVRIPGHVDGKVIRHIGAYAFSDYKEQEEAGSCHEAGGEVLSEERSILAGNRVEALYLPETIETVGKYAFYGCTAWKHLVMTDRVKSFGAGAFIDCRLEHVEVYFHKGEQSCLKDVLEEVRSRMVADLYFEETGEQSRLCFPEYYEEEVENGPARIFEVKYLGTGYRYRQCFYEREVDYRAYDQLFPRAAANEKPEVLYDILTGRLIWPYRLSDEARQLYERYMQEHLAEMVQVISRRNDLQLLNYMAERNLWKQEALEQAITWLAAGNTESRGDTAMLSFLMNERHRCFPPVRKEFKL